jgi:hypothetical protein
LTAEFPYTRVQIKLVDMFAKQLHSRMERGDEWGTEDGIDNDGIAKDLTSDMGRPQPQGESKSRLSTLAQSLMAEYSVRRGWEIRELGAGPMRE